jgi:hypothetical protein
MNPLIGATLPAFGSYKLEPIYLAPKLQLSPKVQVSDAFREQFNTYLLDRFGYVESPVEPGEFLVSEAFRTIMGRPEDLSVLKAVIDS